MDRILVGFWLVRGCRSIRYRSLMLPAFQWFGDLRDMKMGIITELCPLGTMVEMSHNLATSSLMSDDAEISRSKQCRLQCKGCRNEFEDAAEHPPHSQL